MNWGKGLLIGMICFMGFIITLVTVLMQQKIDLVTDNYYVKELDYDNTLSAQNNYENSGAIIKAHVANGSLMLEIPPVFQEDSIHAYLFRPNDATRDLSWSFKAKEHFSIPVNQLPGGRYELTLTGTCRGKGFQSKHQLAW